jgi:DNA-binding transcriptional LysR family regulator
LPIQAELAVQRVATDRLAFVFPARFDGSVDDFTSPLLRALPFIALQPHVSPGLEHHIQRLFAARGFQPTRIHRVNASLTVLSMVASGLGVGLMHESSLRGFVDPRGAVHVRIIDDDVARWDVGLIWRPEEQSPAVIRFLRAARDALGATHAPHEAWRIPPLAARN